MVVIQIAVAKGWMPHLWALNTSTKGDTVNNVKLKPMFQSPIRMIAWHTQTGQNSHEWSFGRSLKWTKMAHPFWDSWDDTEESCLLAIKNGSFTPASAEANMACQQLAHYVGAQHSLQLCHFLFSIIHRHEAWFLWWDPFSTIMVEFLCALTISLQSSRIMAYWSNQPTLYLISTHEWGSNLDSSMSCPVWMGWDVPTAQGHQRKTASVNLHWSLFGLPRLKIDRKSVV